MRDDLTCFLVGLLLRVAGVEPSTTNGLRSRQHNILMSRPTRHGVLLA